MRGPNLVHFCLGAVAALIVGASPAAACIAEAPPQWHRLIGSEGPPIVIGRVTQVTRNPEPRRNEYFEVWVDTATIRPVDTIQGVAAPEYQVTGVGDFTRLKDGLMFCGDRMGQKVGDVVFGYERPDGSLRLLSIHHIPEDLRPRYEAAQ